MTNAAIANQHPVVFKVGALAKIPVTNNTTAAVMQAPAPNKMKWIGCFMADSRSKDKCQPQSLRL